MNFDRKRIFKCSSQVQLHQAERMSLPTPSFSTAALHSDSQPHHIDSNEPVAPSLQLATTYRAIHPGSDLAQQIEQEGIESLDFQNASTHIYSRYTSDTRGRAEQVLTGLMVSRKGASDAI